MANVTEAYETLRVDFSRDQLYERLIQPKVAFLTILLGLIGEWPFQTRGRKSLHVDSSLLIGCNRVSAQVSTTWSCSHTRLPRSCTSCTSVSRDSRQKQRRPLPRRSNSRAATATYTKSHHMAPRAGISLSPACMP